MRALLPLVVGVCLASVASAVAEPAGHAHAHGFGDRPDAHAPLGVMAEHAHAPGEWMVSYRYLRMRMDGNRSSTRHRSRSRVLEDFPVTPTDMDVGVHLWGLMFAPTGRLTLMAMLPLLDKEMDHVRRDGVGFETDASGLGDLRLGAILTLWHDETHRVLLNGGLGLPTGAIDRKDTLPPPAGRQRLPYPMQLGSGSVDFVPGVTAPRRSARSAAGTTGGTTASATGWTRRAGSRSRSRAG